MLWQEEETSASLVLQLLRASQGDHDVSCQAAAKKALEVLPLSKEDVSPLLQAAAGTQNTQATPAKRARKAAGAAKGAVPFVLPPYRSLNASEGALHCCCCCCC